MRGFASGGSIRSSDIPVAGGGRGERGQECPRSLPLRFGESVGAPFWRSMRASLRRSRKGFASGGSIRSSDIPVAGGDVPYGDRNVPAPYRFAPAEA